MDQAEGMQVQSNVPPGTSSTEGMMPEEKMLKQSDVNELVGRVRHDAFEKGKREALASISPKEQPAQGQSMGGIQQVTDDQIRQIMAEEAQKQAQMAEVKNTLDNFARQMGSGKGKYSDFDETVANLGDLQNIPHVVHLATDTGMAGDVMYELGRNPGKVASLTTLAYINPHLAKVEMKKLADSIKMNQEQSKDPSVNEPLSQIKPSTVGTDTGSNSVRDLRKKAYLRG